MSRMKLVAATVAPALLFAFLAAHGGRPAPGPTPLHPSLAFRTPGGSRDLSVDPEGNVYLFDYDEYIIRKFDPSGRRQRTREIGIRMALGSTRERVTTMVLGEGMGLMAVGTGLGLVGAVVITRFLRALLFEVSTLDVATLAGVAVLLMVTSLAATLLPARRAARVDPVTALREG